tara:strand:+ start:137892 stop:138638 length:747 start_codon:yes stop_codon:yes gene_type:complete
MIQESQPPTRVVNSYHQISDSWFYRRANLLFSQAIRTDVNFGHYFTKSVGYELSGSYFKPFDETTDDGYLNRQLTGQFYQVSFKILLRKQINKFDLYAKMGVNYVTGKMYFDQLFYTQDETYSINEARMIYEYNDGAQWGFNGAMGVRYALNDRLSIYGEFYSLFQPFTPARGQMTHHTYDDENAMQYSEDPYYSEIHFGDSQDNWYTSDDTSKPQKMYKRSHSLSGIGVNIGLTINIWSKKEDSEND